MTSPMTIQNTTVSPSSSGSTASNSLGIGFRWVEAVRDRLAADLYGRHMHSTFPSPGPHLILLIFP